MRNTRPSVWMEGGGAEISRLPGQGQDRLLDALTVVARGGMRADRQAAERLSARACSNWRSHFAAMRPRGVRRADRRTMRG